MSTGTVNESSTIEATRAEVDRIVRSTIADKLREVMGGARLPVHDLTPKDFALALVEHNRHAVTIRDALESAVGMIVSAIKHAIETGTVANLGEEISFGRDSRLALLQNIVAWWMKAGDLAQQHANQLRPIVDQHFADAEQTVEKVKRELTAIGCGIEGILNHPEECGQAAAGRLDAFARRHNIHARAALAKAADTRVQYDAVVEKISDSKQRLAQARKLLQRAAVDAVGKAL